MHMRKVDHLHDRGPGSIPLRLRLPFVKEEQAAAVETQLRLMLKEGKQRAQALHALHDAPSAQRCPLALASHEKLPQGRLEALLGYCLSPVLVPHQVALLPTAKHLRTQKGGVLSQWGWGVLCKRPAYPHAADPETQRGRGGGQVLLPHERTLGRRCILAGCVCAHLHIQNARFAKPVREVLH